MSRHPISDSLPRRPRSLALGLVERLNRRIKLGELVPGDKLPTEAQIMETYGVSRTVVREALSNLQAAGLVETRHGIGTFVLEPVRDGDGFVLAPDRLETLRDVVAILELRTGVETEAAGLAAERRTSDDLVAMQAASDAFRRAGEGRVDAAAAVAADLDLHMTIARASRNVHFEDMMACLGRMLFPRARVAMARDPQSDRRANLSVAADEHDAIVAAIRDGDQALARAAMRIHFTNSRMRVSPLHDTEPC